MNQAETALADIKKKEASEKIEASKMKYEALKLLFKLKCSINAKLETTNA
jgi:hypothetical protein